MAGGASRVAQLVLFTRPQCSLCDTAKMAIDNVRKRRQLGYAEINVLKSEHARWKDVYEFDTPVLHVQRPKDPATHPIDVPRSQKLFHRFTAQQIVEVVNRAEST